MPGLLMQYRGWQKNHKLQLKEEQGKSDDVSLSWLKLPLQKKPRFFERNQLQVETSCYAIFLQRTN